MRVYDNNSMIYRSERDAYKLLEKETRREREKEREMAKRSELSLQLSVVVAVLYSGQLLHKRRNVYNIRCCKRVCSYVVKLRVFHYRYILYVAATNKLRFLIIEYITFLGCFLSGANIYVAPKQSYLILLYGSLNTVGVVSNIIYILCVCVFIQQTRAYNNIFTCIHFCTTRPAVIRHTSDAFPRSIIIVENQAYASSRIRNCLFVCKTLNSHSRVQPKTVYLIMSQKNLTDFFLL